MRHVAIPGFSRYEINESAEIRRVGSGRVLKGWLDAGYRKVELYDDQGQPRTLRVGRLMLLVFAGPSELEACHRDDDGDNNDLSNLYWGTHQQNMLDKVTNGRHHNAVKTHCGRGHEYTPENTKRRVQGTWRIRQCRACNRADARQRRRERKTS